VSVAASLERWLFGPAPATRLATLRIGIAGFSVIYLLARARYLTDFSSMSARAFEPVGVIGVLERPLPEWLAMLVFGVALTSSVGACLGRFYRVSGPVWGLSLLWVLSYRNSWGMVFHTDNLLVLHALVLAVAPAADAWSLDARHKASPGPAAHARYAWPVRALALIVVCSYVVAAVAKLRIAGLDWLGGHEIRSHIAFDALRKLELGSVHSALGAALVRYEAVFAPLAWLTLAIELGAPLALLGGRWATTWACLAWGFHASVLLLMAIVFAYPLLGLAYAPLFAVEEPIQRWISARRRKTSAANLPPP
jgi:hypothetical protein